MLKSECEEIKNEILDNKEVHDEKNQRTGWP